MIFAARIRAAAAAAGRPVVLLTGGDGLVSRVRSAVPGLLLIDLDARWLDAAALISALKADPATAGVPVVAFGSHLRTEALAAARAAGAELVLARSVFVRKLPELVGHPVS